MPRRPGSGRKPGGHNSDTEQVSFALVTLSGTPAERLAKLIQSPSVDLKTRLNAARRLQTCLGTKGTLHGFSRADMYRANGHILTRLKDTAAADVASVLAALAEDTELPMPQRLAAAKHLFGFLLAGIFHDDTMGV